ncbi:DUF4396 domain-containing protein [Streptomyces alfalfae]|uniref:DUF4396 domain-containing protein n=1 Tax=Streptomyces alfalfae TaxID=1642299 RepID=A0A7T4PH70_9ACTN|nr:DUF4396 domain-containing protein [Streptomyces alfalfae]QQC90202.1 DUF4396 domain-containing protein [Streptomyces alfalfae]
MDHSAHHTGTGQGDHAAHHGSGVHGGYGDHGGRGGHGGHGGHAREGVSWAMAAKATLHCLTGCAIGEILGMVIGTALMWGNVPTMALAVTLAFLFGYSFTLFAVLRSGLDFRSAVKVALAADTVSIAVMELVDNGIVALTPGAMDAHLSDGLFWSALLGGFAVAFLITTPVNKWMIGRGKGHAVVHAHH